MAVSMISLYASPPSSVCTSSHTINSHDLERSSSSVPSTSTSASRPVVIGGLQRTSYKKQRDHQSPVSAVQRPIGLSRSPTQINGGWFNGFPRVDCDLSSFRLYSCLYDVDEDRFTFDMEAGVGAGSGSGSVWSVEGLLASARRRHKIFYDGFVVKAFYEAEKAHRGQVRASGHPYLQHCVETAVLLATLGANSTVVAAALLHDTIDDSVVTYDYIFSLFGAGVADLVQGVSKLSHLSKLARENDTASKATEADRLHTMFLAMADARAVLIKLADRLHNMMTLDALPVHKQHRFAKETLEIFAPLANRLGISTWKEELENLCFEYLYPTQYDDLSSKLVKSFDQELITSATEKLERALKDEGISYCDLSGRHKSLYSIYRKMLKKKLTMDQVHDIHGLRLIVENEDDCYRALKVVHQLWSKVPGKLKDYIHCPKWNGYQSIHTVVVGEETIPLEVQIRTREMHLQAEYGLAAHWRYKEGDSKHPSFVLQMVEWARWVVTWHCETMNQDPLKLAASDSIRPACKFPAHSENCPYSYLPKDSHDGPVFVILIENDKMSVQEFAAGSTVMDLLEKTGHGGPQWTLYGIPVKEELRPRLNSEPVSDPTWELKMGDVVELTPALPNKSLVEYREEIQRMYYGGLSVSTLGPGAATVYWRTRPKMLKQ